MEFFTFLTRQRVVLATLVFLTSMTSIWAQCPTVDNAAPNLCDDGTSNVASLNEFVTDQGAGVSWYAAANGGVALAAGDLLVSGTTYFVDNATGDCGARAGVSVTLALSVVNKPVSNNVAWGLCRESATVLKTLQDGINLDTFVGDDSALRYYADEFTTTQMLVTDELATGAFVWAAAVDPLTGCQSERQAVVVLYIDAIMPVGETPQAFCKEDGVVHTMADIATDTGNTYYLDNNPLSANVAGTTPIQDGVSYFISNKQPGCESARIEVLVNLVDPKDAGEGVVKPVCITDIANELPLDLFNELDGTPLATGTWTDPQGLPIAGGNAPIVDITGLPEGQNVYTYTLPAAADPATDPCPPPTATVIVNVLPIPDAGTDGVVTFCSSQPVGVDTDLFASLGGTPDTGGVWTPALASGTGQFTPGTDADGVYTYTVTTLPCLPVTATVTVSQDIQSDPGEPSTFTICSADLANAGNRRLFNRLGGTPDAGGVWTTNSGIAITNDDRGVIDVSSLSVIDSPYTFTYTVPAVGLCLEQTADVQIVVEEVKLAGQDANALICNNEGVVDLITRIGGNPDAGGVWTFGGNPATGMFDPLVDLAGIYTYTVDNVDCVDDVSNLTVTIGNFVDPGVGVTMNKCITNIGTEAPIDLFAQLTGTPDAGGTWTNPQGAVIAGGNNPAPVDITGLGVGTHNYTYTTTGDCDNTAVVVVIVDPEPDAGITVVDPIAVCSADGNLNLTNQLGGAPQAGGQWTFGGANVAEDLDLTTAQSGLYTYTVTSIGCNNRTDISTLTLNVEQALNTGVAPAVKELCISTVIVEPDVILFNELGPNADRGGTWAVPQGSGIVITDGDTGTIAVSALPVGDYNFVYSFVAPCALPPTTVSINIKPQLSAGDQDNALTICSAAPAVDLFNSVTGNPDTGGVWTGPTNLVGGMFDPAVNTAGIYTYTVTPDVCAVQTANVTVTINQSSNPGTDGARNFCITDLGTIPVFNLFDELGGGPQVDGVWASPDGSGIVTAGGNLGTVDVNTLTEGAHDFTYTVPANVDCPEATSKVTVFIDPVPDAGTSNLGAAVCSADTPFSLITLLGGNPQVGGVWTRGGQVVLDEFDPSIEATGVQIDLIYTVTSIGCNNSTDVSNIALTVLPAPNAGADTIYNLCEGDVATTADLSLFNILTGIPEVGGTWTDPQGAAFGAGHLVTLDVTGFTAGQYAYTYTVPSANASCTADSKVLTISVDPNPDAGTADNNGVANICTSGGIVDLNTLIIGEQVGGVWSFNGSDLVTSNFDPANDTPGQYIYTVTSIGCGTNDLESVVVSLVQGPEAGEDATYAICMTDITSGTTTSVDLFNQLGGANKSVNGTWSDATLTNGNVGTLDLTALAVGTTTYTYTVPASNGCPADNNTVTVEVQPEPVPGTAILPTVLVCDTGAAFDLNDLLNGSLAGGVWSFNNADLATSTFTPGGVGASTPGVYTYTVTSTACAIATQSATVTIGIRPNPFVTSITSAGAVCSNTPATVNFVGAPDAEVTFNVAGGANEIITLAADGTGSFTTQGNIIATTTFNLVSVAYPGPKGCSQAAVGSADVTIEALPNATITGSTTICSGTGAVITFAGDSNAVVTYTIDGGANQQVTLDGAGTFVLPTGNLTADTKYALVSVASSTANACSQNLSVADVDITVISTPSVTTFTVPANACIGTNASIDFIGTPNTTVSYVLDGVADTIPLAADGTASIVTVITALTTNPLNIALTDITTGGVTPCNSVLTDTGSIAIGILPTVDFAVSTNTVCAGNPINLEFTNGLNGATSVDYTITTVDGVTSHNAVLSGGAITEQAIIAKDATIQITSINGSCTNSAPTNGPEVVTTTVAPNVASATVTVDSSTGVCYDIAATVNISGATNLVTGQSYNITYSLSGANSVAAITVPVTITAGAGTFAIPESELTNDGLTTVSIDDIASVITGCNVTGATFANTASFTILPEIVNTIPSNSAKLDFCIGSTDSILFSDLESKFDLPTGHQIRWYTDANGTAPVVGDSATSGVVYHGEVYNPANTCSSGTSQLVSFEVNRCHVITSVVTPGQGVDPESLIGNPTLAENGVNAFYIYDIDVLFPNYTYEVYNRYGVKLFTGNKLNPSWNGISTEGNVGGSDVVPTGVYFYVINFNKGNIKPEQGYFYLSR